MYRIMMTKLFLDTKKITNISIYLKLYLKSTLHLFIIKKIFNFMLEKTKYK